MLLETTLRRFPAPAEADLLAPCCTVSIETMRIVDALAARSPLRPGA